MVHRLSERDDEAGPRLHLVLPNPEEVAPVRTALSVIGRSRGRLQAHSLRRRGEDLPAELRIARYGLGASREADRAVRTLVDAAVRGARVDVRPLPSDADLSREAAETLGAEATSAMLLVAWTRQGPTPDIDRLRPFLAGWRGPVGLLFDDRGPPHREVLGLGPGPDQSEAARAADGLVRGLERNAPAYPVVPRDDAEAREALADVGPRTLVVAPVAAGTPRQLGDAATLEERIPGRLILVFGPAEGRLDRVLGLIEAVSAGRAERAAS